MKLSVVASAKAAVLKGRNALRTLSEQVAADEHSSTFSALHGAPSIIDAYSSTGARVEADVRESEQREAELRVLRDEAETCWRRCAVRSRQYFIMGTRAPSTWIFLLLLGTLSALMAFSVEAPVASLIDLRERLIAENPAAGFIIWILWTLVGGLIAGTVGHLVPLTEGSGIPQIKSILSGSTLHHYLSARIGFTKMIGLIAAQGGGLSTGREGPFVHVACCVAAKLWRVPYFRSIAGNDHLQRQMLAAAVAAGVTGVFGAPISGLFFGMEVTSTYLLTTSLWRCMVCAVTCKFFADLLGLLKDEAAGFRTTAFAPGQMSADIIAFAALGAFCGILGSLFVYTLTKIRIARKIVMTSTRRRYGLIALISLVVGAMTFITPYTRKSDLAVANDLFSGDDAQSSHGPSMADWASPNVGFSLCVYFLVKLLSTVLSISLPIPCGLFMPLFLLGATAGRLFGELVRIIMPSATPGVFAVVGAAALTSGATNTISTAIMVFELTGQVSHLLPVFVGTLVAYSVSSVFTISVYDVLLQLAGLPFLPRVFPSGLYQLTAAHVMRTDAPFLTLSSTYADAQRLLEAHSQVEVSGTSYAHRTVDYAIVDSIDSMVLLGAVSRAELERCFERRWQTELLAEAGRDLSAARSLPFRIASAVSHEAPQQDDQSALQPVLVKQPAPISGGGKELGYCAPAMRPSFSSDSPLSLNTFSGPDPQPFELIPVGPQPVVHSTPPQHLATPDLSQIPQDLVAPSATSNGDDTSPKETLRWSSRQKPEDSQRLVTPPTRNTTLRNQTSPRPQPQTLLRRGALWLQGALIRGPGALSEHVFDVSWLHNRIVWAGLPDAARVPPTQPALSDATADAGSQSPVMVDPAPFQVAAATPLPKVHYLFCVCLFAELFVTRDGRLAGVIVKDDLGDGRRVSRERLLLSAESAAPVGEMHP